MLPVLLLALRITSATPDVPLKQPQIAASGQTVVLTYGAGSAVYFARSLDGGKTFSKPVQVGEAKRLALGRHRGPRVALAGTNIVITAVTHAEAGSGGDLLAWSSSDGGRSWSQRARVNDAPTSAREGLHGMAAAGDGTVWVVWLDLREKGMQLYGALSKDGGKTWGANQRVYSSPDGNICECCHPTAYIGPKGELYAMWRNWLSGSRDMYYATSTDRKSWAIQKLGQGTWPLNACPMDGGGLTLDARGGVHTVWRRDGTVYQSSGAEPESALGRGKDPAITAGKDGVYIAWTDNTVIKLKKPGSADVLVLGEGAFPALAGSGPVYAAWENQGAITVEPIQ